MKLTIIVITRKTNALVFKKDSEIDDCYFVDCIKKKESIFFFSKAEWSFVLVSCSEKPSWIIISVYKVTTKFIVRDYQESSKMKKKKIIFLL